MAGVSESPGSPVARLQVLQALVARELVVGFGLPERQAALLLGLVPSSVSQYLSGKRRAPALSGRAADEASRRIARHAAQRLLEGTDAATALLEAAIALGEADAPADALPVRDGAAPPRREVPKWLARRIAGEQQAVADCMRLAQRSRDELTRALFRQIASDSLRHAEIVASLASYLDRGLTASPPLGVTREEITGLIESEHAAEASVGDDVGPELGGVMRILWESMEADERKHERILEALLATAPAAGGGGRPRAPPSASATAPPNPAIDPAGPLPRRTGARRPRDPA